MKRITVIALALAAITLLGIPRPSGMTPYLPSERSAGLPLFLPSVQAQDVFLTATERLSKSEPVSATLTTDNADVALLIRYVGPSTGTTSTSNSGKLAVSASALTFTSGAFGSEVADTSMECPVSGPLGGIIDITNAACNTIGKVLDILNAPSSNWRAIALDSMRSDTLATTVFTTYAATTANAQAGLAVNWATAVKFQATQAMVPLAWRTLAPYLLQAGTGSGLPRKLQPNIFDRQRGILLKANETSTFGSGTSSFEVWSVIVGPLTASNGAGSETTQLLYSEAGGATTVNKVFDFTPYGVFTQKNGKMLIRINNSAAGSAVRLIGYGVSMPYSP